MVIFFMNYEQERVRIDTYGSIIRCDNRRILKRKKTIMYISRSSKVKK